MPPNPNWGWKLNNGQYEIDPELHKASKDCDNIRLQTSNAGDQQKKEIKEILDLQTKTGIAAITDPINEEVLSKNKQEFLEKIENYSKKYSQPEHTQELQKKVVEKAGITSERNGLIEKSYLYLNKILVQNIRATILSQNRDRVGKPLDKSQSQSKSFNTTRYNGR